MLWSSVAKAFDKSRYTLMGVVPLTKCCVLLSVLLVLTRQVLWSVLF